MIDRRQLRGALLGSSVSLLVGTTYLLLTGYTAQGLIPPGFVTLSMALFGAGAGAGLAAGFRPSVALVCVPFLALFPIRFAPPNPATPGNVELVGIYVLGATLVLTVAILGEWTIRNRARVRSFFTRETLLVGAFGATIHALAFLSMGSYARTLDPFDWMRDVGGLPTDLEQLVVVTLVFSYFALGLIALGAVAAISRYRFELVSPPSVLVLVFASVSYGTWRSFDTVRTTDVDPGISPRIDTVYLMGWVLVLGLIVVTGALEYACRRRFDVEPPNVESGADSAP